MGKGTRFFGRVPHGLEEVAWRDVSKRCSAHLIQTSHRLIEFSCASSVPELLSLRSLEDLFVFLGEVREVTHLRSMISYLASHAHSLDFDGVGQLKLKPELDLRRPVRFSITASFLGKRNYSRWEIADALGAELSRIYGWKYVSLEHPISDPVALHIRVHIEGSRAVLGARLADIPLYKRTYKLSHQPGSLNPCVAYLMTVLARSNKGGVLLDPACGVGTIPIEAAASGWHRAIGVDIEYSAIEQAKENGQGFSNSEFLLGDLFNLASCTSPVDAIVVDLPWGSQTSFAADKTAYSAGQNRSRLLVNSLLSVSAVGCLWVIMSESDTEELTAEIARHGLSVKEGLQISLSGRHPWILVVE